MIKIDTGTTTFLIEGKDIKEGINDISKRSGINLLTNGIYRLYNKDGVLLYIGRGKVLNRVFSHMTGNSGNTKRFWKEIERAEITILPLYSVGKTEDLEQYLIKILKPKYNRRKWSDYAIMYRIKEFEI